MRARSEPGAGKRLAPGAMLAAAVVLYVGWLLASYGVLLAADLRYLWHVPLYGVALLLSWKPALIRPRRPGMRASVAHHVTVGGIYGAFLCHPLATLGTGDLHPSVPMNSALWLGSYVAFHAAWAWLLRRRAWSTLQIVAMAGTVGLADPNLMLLRAALSGDWRTVLLFAPVLHAVFAASLAPPVCAYRDARGGDRAPHPTRLAVLLALVVPNLAYRFGLVWAFGILYALRSVA
jgi:hypothetical protein